MEVKPIIIVGGGLWGILLLHRIRETSPTTKVLLYDTAPVGIKHSCSFRKSELNPEEFKWVRPYLSQAWRFHDVTFKDFHRSFDSFYYNILPGQFEKMTKELKPFVRIVSQIDLEELLEVGSCVIDTRPNPHQKMKCTRQTLGLIIDLMKPHGLQRPIILDTDVKQKSLHRHMQYLPLDEYTLLVKDIRYYRDEVESLEPQEDDLLWEVRKRWKIKGVLGQESEKVLIPATPFLPWNHGRIINLAGVMNMVTGDEFCDAVRLIDQMTKTSLRLGELKEVIQRYRTEKLQSRGFTKIITRMLYHAPQASHRLQVLKYLHELPEYTLDKFLEGRISVMDLGRAIIEKPPVTLMRNFSTLISRA